MEPMFRELFERKASLFVASEQFGPVDAAGKARKAGVRSFIVGTGGAGLYSTNYADSWPFREAYNLHNHGVLKIKLKANGYSWTFLPVTETTDEKGKEKKIEVQTKIVKNMTTATCNTRP
jgi:hypothetical protein